VPASSHSPKERVNTVLPCGPSPLRSGFCLCAVGSLTVRVRARRYLSYAYCATYSLLRAYVTGATCGRNPRAATHQAANIATCPQLRIRYPDRLRKPTNGGAYGA